MANQNFRDQLVAAPLKLVAHLIEPVGERHFRDQLVAAPLKPNQLDFAERQRTISATNWSRPH